MLQLKQFEVQDFIKLSILFQYLADHARGKDVELFKYEYNGEENVLCRANKTCFVFNMKYDNFISKRRMFELVANNASIIKKVVVGNYYVYLNPGIEFEKIDSNIIEIIKPTVYDNAIDVYGNNGRMLYAQYNRNTKGHLTMYYPYNQNVYDERPALMPSSLKTPTVFIYKKNIDSLKLGSGSFQKAEQYYLMQFDAKSLAGSIIKFNESGLAKLNNEDKEEKMERYFSGKFSPSLKRAITTCPFGHAYTKEELFGSVKKLGFNTEVSKEVIQIYNNGIKDLDEYNELMQAIREYKMGPKSSNLSLRLTQVKVDK